MELPRVIPNKLHTRPIGSDLYKSILWKLAKIYKISPVDDFYHHFTRLSEDLILTMIECQLFSNIKLFLEKD